MTIPFAMQGDRFYTNFFCHSWAEEGTVSDHFGTFSIKGLTL